MPQLEDQGTSTLPPARQKAQLAPASILVTSFFVAVSSVNPSSVPRHPERSPFVEIDVDADLPATISRVVHRRTLLFETYGAENTAANLARETSLRNDRRVELLTKRLTGSLNASESREFDALQATEGARFGARLRAGNERLQRLLQS